MNNHFIVLISLLSLNSVDNFEIELGSKYGITSKSTTIPFDTLQIISIGAENGNPDNMYFLALLKLYGISVSQNETSAAQYFKKAAILDHVDAQTAYGMMLLTGKGVDIDYKEAIIHFRKAIEQGDNNAKWMLAKMLIEGKGVPNPMYEEAYELLLQVTREVHIAEAEHQLALLYEYGLGTKQDWAKAAEYYRLATSKEHLESMYNLALMYAYGRGCEQDFQRAISLFERASRSHHAPSVYYMGIMKAYGYGTEINYEQAFNWFELAAGLKDERISEKAAKAAENILKLKIEAEKFNNDKIDRYKKRSEEL